MQYIKLGAILRTLVCLVCLLITAGNSNPVSCQDAPDASKWLEQSTNANKYLFVLFFKDKTDANTREMTEIFNKAKTTFSEKALFVEVNIDNPSEQDFIKRFEVDKISKPAILAIAPGGIVTKKFTDKIKPDELTDAFVTPATLELLKATQNNKYLVVFFFNDKDESNTRTMSEVFNKGKTTYSAKAVFIEINITDKTEDEFIKRFEADKIAKPSILAIAPGGIVTKAFIRKIKLEEFEEAFVTPKKLEIIKATQEKKLVILLFNNDKLEDSNKATAIVDSVVKLLSKKFPIQVIIVNPADETEKNLLKEAKVSPDIKKPVVVVIQNGALKGTIEEGKLTDKTLTNLINKTCGNCGPGG